MKKLKATWTIDMTALEDANRGYEMTIEPGGLYEVWLILDDHPKPAIAIRQSDHIGVWQVLVEGRLIPQQSGRIFRTGTATLPPTSVEELQRLMADQIQQYQDQKILKLLIEKENP
jgi:hypothetical protein